MSIRLDETHDPALRSWVESANDPASDHPIQNLPLGVFNPGGVTGDPRLGVAIGSSVLDLRAASDGLMLGDLGRDLSEATSAATLNPLMALGGEARRRLRQAVSRLLRHGSEPMPGLLHDQAAVTMALPATIGDYTDFYCSIHHATNVGSMFRPDNPLLPNYRHLPIGYHGRASSIVTSGTPVRRPRGQIVPAGADAPQDAPSRLLDYELEMGCFVGRGNPLGRRIAMSEIDDHLFGVCIVNDWSARDVQKWEYQPLGPFNAKNFGTTISPWVVTAEALAPFRVEGPERGADDPGMLEYLRPAGPWALDVTVEVTIASATMRERGIAPMRISRASMKDLYWTLAQMLVHHASTGCNLRPGDLIATGTISGPDEEGRGCLLERTWRGEQPIALPDGTERKFLQDGDEVAMRAWAERPGARRIGFGGCVGVVLPAE